MFALLLVECRPYLTDARRRIEQSSTPCRAAGGKPLSTIQVAREYAGDAMGPSARHRVSEVTKAGTVRVRGVMLLDERYWLVCGT